MNSKKKLTTTAVALVTSAALLLGGTFAWQSINQTALNESSDVVNPGGRLHDDFDGENKDVYVENFAEEPIYARIRLEEYFGVVLNQGTPGEKSVDVIGTRTPGTDEDGNTVYDLTYETYLFDGNVNGDGTVSAAVADGESYWSWTVGGETVFMPTFNKNKDSRKADINGEYRFGTGVLSDKDDEDGQYEGYVDYSLAENAEKTANAVYDIDSNRDDEIADADLAALIDPAQTNADTYDSDYVKLLSETHTAKPTATAQLISMADWLAMNGVQTAAEDPYGVSPAFAQNETAVLHYDKNAEDAEGHIDDVEEPYDTVVTLSDGTAFSRDGYTLVGWNTSADGSGESYDLGAEWTMAQGETTMYAVWQQGEGEQEEAAAYWVYDTDGWVYYSEPIAPNSATGLLLNGIELTQVMDESWFYAINVVGQFVTADDMGSAADGTGFYQDGGTVSDDALTLLEEIGVNVNGDTGENGGDDAPGWYDTVSEMDAGTAETVEIDGVAWFVLRKTDDGKALLQAAEPVGGLIAPYNQTTDTSAWDTELAQSNDVDKVLNTTSSTVTLYDGSEAQTLYAKLPALWPYLEQCDAYEVVDLNSGNPNARILTYTGYMTLPGRYAAVPSVYAFGSVDYDHEATFYDLVPAGQGGYEVGTITEEMLNVMLANAGDAPIMTRIHEEENGAYTADCLDHIGIKAADNGYELVSVSNTDEAAIYPMLWVDYGAAADNSASGGNGGGSAEYEHELTLDTEGDDAITAALGEGIKLTVFDEYGTEVDASSYNIEIQWDNGEVQWLDEESYTFDPDTAILTITDAEETELWICAYNDDGLESYATVTITAGGDISYLQLDLVAPIEDFGDRGMPVSVGQNILLTNTGGGADLSDVHLSGSSDGVDFYKIESDSGVYSYDGTNRVLVFLDPPETYSAYRIMDATDTAGAYVTLSVASGGETTAVTNETIVATVEMLKSSGVAVTLKDENGDDITNSNDVYYSMSVTGADAAHVGFGNNTGATPDATIWVYSLWKEGDAYELVLEAHMGAEAREYSFTLVYESYNDEGDAVIVENPVRLTVLPSAVSMTGPTEVVRGQTYTYTVTLPEDATNVNAYISGSDDGNHTSAFALAEGDNTSAILTVAENESSSFLHILVECTCADDEYYYYYLDLTIRDAETD